MGHTGGSPRPHHAATPHIPHPPIQVPRSGSGAPTQAHPLSMQPPAEPSPVTVSSSSGPRWPR